MAAKLNVDLYKPSGKWAYGFSVWIEQPLGYVETRQLLQFIAVNQKEVTPAAVVNGSYHVVIKETPESMENPHYTGFLCRMVPATNTD